MKPVRKIIRTVDAMASQNRMIIWLECHHKVSLTLRDLVAAPKVLHEAVQRGTVECPFCPDEPEPVEARVEKTAQQLYKEAGEP